METVCKTPVLYRMALRAETQVGKWEIDKKQPYDTATIGSSALLVALKRNLCAELAGWLGFYFASIYNDWEKNFDTLDLETVMTKVVYNDFPLPQLSFALMQHMAPRVIQANGCSSQAISVDTSILAGCKFSVAITRVYAMRHLKQLNEEHPGSRPEICVDDTCMHTKGLRIPDVMNTLIPAMLAFQKVVGKLKLRLSPKASIIQSQTNLPPSSKNHCQHLTFQNNEASQGFRYFSCQWQKQTRFAN